MIHQGAEPHPRSAPCLFPFGAPARPPDSPHRMLVILSKPPPLKLPSQDFPAGYDITFRTVPYGQLVRRAFLALQVSRFPVQRFGRHPLRYADGEQS